MKSEVSLFRGLAFVSVSVCSLLFAYKLRKDRNRTDTLCTSAQAHKMIGLEEGQTILAVVDTRKSMHFYIGNDGMEGKDYE